MTEPTPKPEIRNYARLVAGCAIVFAICIAVMLAALPGPHTRLDFLIIGTLGTLFTLLFLFLMLAVRRR